VKTKPKGKTVCRGLRIDESLIVRIQRAATDGGFASPTAFMRSAIERELAGRESGVDTAEERGKVRYDRFLKSVGAGMAGDSQAAMAELLKRGEEN
jgi:hypothetical protein